MLIVSRWYKRNGADFIDGTMGLSLEEKGAYSLCLDLIYDREGPIPDDARWLSGICGVSIRKWNALRERLIADGKLYIENGKIGNVRADFELVSSEKYRRNQAESGAKGGRKAAENKADVNKNNDLAQATLKPNRAEQSIEDKDTNVSLPRARKGCRLPPDWQPIDEPDFNLGLRERELSRFRDYWVGVPGSKGVKLDWQATWRNWIRKASDNHGKTFNNRPTDALAAVLDRRIAKAAERRSSAEFADIPRLAIASS